MTLDSLPNLDTSGLCLVKTLSTALTCWPYRNMALRDGARTSTRSFADAVWPVSRRCRPGYVKGRSASTKEQSACCDRHLGMLAAPMMTAVWIETKKAKVPESLLTV